MKKIFLPVLIISFCLIVFARAITYAQTATPEPTNTTAPNNSQAVQDTKNRIKELEGKISELKGTEQSLKSQIEVMDSQINLTELRISSTKAEINELGKNIDVATQKIGNLESSLDKITIALLKRIISKYENGTTEQLPIFTTAENFNNYVNKSNYLKIIQEHDRKLLFEMQQAKNDYANQKQLYEDREKKLEALNIQLEAYTQELDAEQDKKKELLAQTQGDEANYQRLLAEAKAQLAGFSRFTANQGGAGLLSNQTACDDWGCYYSQRDSQWGGVPLNGTQYTLASDGCLVTSMAMVYTHLGHRGVTPGTINAISDNFASYYPAFLNKQISANGVTTKRIHISFDSSNSSKITAIDSEVTNGRPVVVGINAYGGTHFIVIKSGANGSYFMHDPYLENGHDVPFTSHYSISNIFDIEKVEVQ